MQLSTNKTLNVYPFTHDGAVGDVSKLQGHAGDNNFAGLCAWIPGRNKIFRSLDGT